MHHLILAVAAVLAFTVEAALGDACNWTGAGGNAYWTNANNWAEGRIPGRWLEADDTQAGGVATNGVKGEVAIFGDQLVAGGATTIDFDGVYSISNLITTGTAHRYTYGTSASQNVPIEPWGRFTVAELENTPVAQVPTARIVCGMGIKNGEFVITNEVLQLGKWNSWYGSETIKFRNNSLTEEFAFENTWGYPVKDPISNSGGGQTGIQFEGPGSFRISAGCSYNPFFYDCLTTGKLIIDTRFATRAFNVNAPGEGYPADSTTVRQIEITANGAFSSSEGNQNLLTASYPLRIYGDGYFAFCAGYHSSSKKWLSGGVTVYANIDIECATKFRVSSSITDSNRKLLENFPYRIIVYGSKCLRLSGPTTIGTEIVTSTWASQDEIAEDVALGQTGSSSIVLAAPTFDEAWAFGKCRFELVNNAHLRYEGAQAETLTKELFITNVNYSDVVANLQQAGAGEWTVASPVVVYPGATKATLNLCGEEGAAGAVFSGTVDERVAIAPQSGNWTFAPSDGKCAKLAPDGGNLRLGEGVLTIDEIAPSKGTVIFVPNNCTLNVGKIVSPADKPVNFVLLGDSALVTIADNEGNDLAGLKLNELPAVLDGDGHLQFASAGSMNIWARAQSGDWSDATKWSGAFDPLKETYLTAPGADYTVTMDNVETTITNLHLGNLNADRVKLELKNNTHLTIEGRTHERKLLQMQRGALLEVASSTLKLYNRGTANGGQSVGETYSTLDLNGGNIVVSGTGELVEYGIPDSLRQDGLTSNLNGSMVFNTGTVEFKDDAVFKTDAEKDNSVFYHYYKPTNPGETVSVTFRDNAHFNFNYSSYTCHMYGNKGRVTIDCDSQYANTENNNIYRRLYVGIFSGTCELLLKGQCNYQFGNNYMHLGTPYANDDYYSTEAAYAVTGRVVVAGSAKLLASATDRAAQGFGGVVVGQGLILNQNQGVSFLHGELKVQDNGTFTQHRGSFIVGGGPNGDGEVELTGGKMNVVSGEFSASNPLGAVLVGGFGGNGRYRMTAGEFNTKRTVYIGGTTTNAMCNYHKNGERLQQYHNARGAVRVLGGAFATSQDIVLGYDGTGLLELSGGGQVSAASIVVSNTTGQAASMLQFTADASGKCGAIAPATKLKFYAGARLKVDVSARPDKGAVVFNLDEPPEGLTADMIELVGDDEVKYPHRLELSADAKRLVYSVDRGLRLIVR